MVTVNDPIFDTSWKYSLSYPLYNMWGCVFSVCPFPLWWLREYIYTLCYYHHQIGSTNYYPLFMVRSWNNGMRCMSFYILMHVEIWWFQFKSVTSYRTDNGKFKDGRRKWHYKKMYIPMVQCNFDLIMSSKLTWGQTGCISCGSVLCLLTFVVTVW